MSSESRLWRFKVCASGIKMAQSDRDGIISPPYERRRGGMSRVLPTYTSINNMYNTGNNTPTHTPAHPFTRRQALLPEGTPYCPFNLLCLTVQAISNISCSSFKCVPFNPVATLALGFLPAYITCLRL